MKRIRNFYRGFTRMIADQIMSYRILSLYSCYLCLSEVNVLCLSEVNVFCLSNLNVFHINCVFYMNDDAF